MDIIIKFAAVGVAMLVLLLMLKPRLFTILAIFFTLFQFNWFVRYYHAPAILNRATLVLVGLLSIRIILHFLVKNPRFRCKNGLLVPLFIFAGFFLFLTLISNIYNEESLLLGYYNLRYYYIGFTLTFAIYLYLPSILNIDTFKQCLTLIALAQFPICIAKYLAAGSGSTNTLDSVSGSFAGYGELVICQVIALGIVLSEKFILRKNTLSFINSYLLCLILIFPLLLSKSRSASVFVVIIVIFVLTYSLFKRRNLVSALKQIFSTLFICAIFSTLFYYFFWQSGDYDIDKQFDVDYVIDYYMHMPITNSQQLRTGADPNMGRFRAIVTAWEYINQDMVRFFIGHGSGAAEEASFIGSKGILYQKVGSLAGISRNQYSKSLLEFGALGMIAFIVYFYSIRSRIKFSSDNTPGTISTYYIIVFTLAIMSAYTITLSSYFFSFVLAYFIALNHADIAENS